MKNEPKSVVTIVTKSGATIKTITTHEIPKLLNRFANDVVQLHEWQGSSIPLAKELPDYYVGQNIIAICREDIVFFSYAPIEKRLIKLVDKSIVEGTNVNT